MSALYREFDVAGVGESLLSVTGVLDVGRILAGEIVLGAASFWAIAVPCSRAKTIVAKRK